MKISLLYIALLICLIGCSQTHSISIQNRTNENFDSVLVYVNSFKLKFINIPNGKSLRLNFPIDSVNAQHDVMILPLIYIKKIGLITGKSYYNDLGGMSGKYELIINDKLNTKWEVNN